MRKCGSFYVIPSRREIDIYPAKTMASALGSGREGTLGAFVFEWVYNIRSILSRANIVQLIEPPLRPFPVILFGLFPYIGFADKLFFLFLSLKTQENLYMCEKSSIFGTPRKRTLKIFQKNAFFLLLVCPVNTQFLLFGN